MSYTRRRASTNDTLCSRCGRTPAYVAIVHRPTGNVAGWACSHCDREMLEEGPYIDYPLDADVRNSKANRAIEAYNESRDR